MRQPLTVLATLALGLVLPAADFSGTWKLNVEKSQFSVVSSRIASETMTVSPTGPNSNKTSTDIVTKSGEKEHQEINRINDGKERPVTGVGFKIEGLTEIVQEIDASTLKIISKKDGKVVAEITSTISPDGKTMTNRRSFGILRDMLVFERQ